MTSDGGPQQGAQGYIDAIDRINAAHVKNPGTTRESELAKAVPHQKIVGLAKVLRENPSPVVNAALLKAGEAALDLAIEDHFNRIRKRLLETDPATAAKLGDAVFRDRFVVRGIGALDEGFLDDFADLMDAVLDSYDVVFGFAEWSKVPGKKLRVRVHLEDEIKRPPHFAPQFPYHTEIDMPVINPAGFKSPTPKGQMMFYGLCHELGHVIAMWGDRNTMEDHHAWAHFTGVVIVEHMSNQAKYNDLLSNRRDVRWRSLDLERKKPENLIARSANTKPAVMSLLIKLHDALGPKAIGDALNYMDEKSAGHRINHVRYYGFDDFQKALLAVVKDAAKQEAVKNLFP